jgi:type IV secretory pathway VirB10-like protein
MATTDDLVLSRKTSRKKLKSANLGWLAIICGGLGLLAVVVIVGIAQMNAKPEASMTGMPSSHQTTQRAPEEQTEAPLFASLGPTGTATAQPVVTRAPAVPAASRSVAYSSGGSGGSYQEQGDPGARQARRQAIEQQQQEERERQQRLDEASGSMGAVAIAKVDDVAAPPGNYVDAAATSSEYAAPSGPILALDAKIPVTIEQSLDSTFSGSFDATVTADVRDETGAVVLIPSGSHCYGKTAQGGVDGQERLYLAANLCKLPNRQRIALADFPAVDVDGATGLKARVDDHGASRRNRGNAFMGVPNMLVGSLVPGIGGSMASSAVATAGQASAGRAIPGPTLYVDASPEHPKAFALLVTTDTPIGGSQ